MSVTALPESPAWLTAKDRLHDADRAWKTLGVALHDRTSGSVIIHKGCEVVTTSASLGLGSQSGNRNLQNGLLKAFGGRFWKRTVTGMFLLGFQQLSGIDGVLFYAPMLFRQAGFSSKESEFLASGVSAILMLVVTIPGLLLADRWGRKTSTITGGLLMSSCMLIIGALYTADSEVFNNDAERWIVIVLIFVFSATFSMTWAIGIKIWVSEMQPLETRAVASSLAYSANWTINWLVAFVTPILFTYSSCGLYFLFGTSTMVTVAVCASCGLPETRGWRLENGE